MTDAEVIERAGMLLDDVTKALRRGDLAEAREYLKAAQALIDGVEHEHEQRGKR